MSPLLWVSPLVSAEYCVTSCDLGVFVDQAAEPVPSQDPDIRAQDGRVLAPAGGFWRSVWCGRWALKWSTYSLRTSCKCRSPVISIRSRHLR